MREVIIRWGRKWLMSRWRGSGNLLINVIISKDLLHIMLSVEELDRDLDRFSLNNLKSNMAKRPQWGFIFILLPKLRLLLLKLITHYCHHI